MASRPKSAADIRTVQVVLLLLLVLVPFSGLWRVEQTDAAIQCSVINALLMPMVWLVIVAIEQSIAVFVARALGDDVIQVDFGFGPKLFVTRIARVQVIWHALPSLSSSYVVSPSAHRQRLRLAASALAGSVVIGIPTLIAFACYSKSGLMKELTVRIAPDILFVLIAGVLAALGGQVTLWLLLGQDATELSLRRRLFWTVTAAGHVDRGAFNEGAAVAQRGLEESPHDPWLQFSLASAHVGAEHADALELLKQLRDGDLPTSLVAPTHNAFAWECCMRGDPANASAADDASRQALDSAPDHPAYLDTRGHVLVWLGRPDEAEPYLRRAYELAPTDSRRAVASAGLAKLYAAKGRPGDAAQWLTRARELGCTPRLLARTIAIVDPLHRA
jgi:hypothetical protein